MASANRVRMARDIFRCGSFDIQDTRHTMDTPEAESNSSGFGTRARVDRHRWPWDWLMPLPREFHERGLVEVSFSGLLLARFRSWLLRTAPPCLMTGMGNHIREQALQTIADKLGELDLPHPVRVGVDGVSASGKTVFSDELAAVLRAAHWVKEAGASQRAIVPPRAV